MLNAVVICDNVDKQHDKLPATFWAATHQNNANFAARKQPTISQRLGQIEFL